MYSMSRKILISITALLFVFFFYSCLEEDCKECRIAVYEDGVLDEASSSDYVIYCEDELDEILNEDPVVIDNKETRYECKE